MARVEIPVITIVREGVEQQAVVTSDDVLGHAIPGNDGTVFIEIVSGDPAPQTVVVIPSPTVEADGLAISPLTLDIAAGATLYCGPFKPSTFNQDAVDREIWLDPSVNGTLSFRAFKIAAARV